MALAVIARSHTLDRERSPNDASSRRSPRAKCNPSGRPDGSCHPFSPDGPANHSDYLTGHDETARFTRRFPLRRRNGQFAHYLSRNGTLPSGHLRADRSAVVRITVAARVVPRAIPARRNVGATGLIGGA